MLPPASAGSGGGSGTAELEAVADALGAVLAAAEGVLRPGVEGAAEVAGDAVADVVAVAEAEVEAEVEADVLGLALVVPDALAGAGAPWKSTQDSVRTVLPPTVTLSAFGVTMYVAVSFFATKVSSEDCVAATISLAPSLTRTPRYSNAPAGVLQMATREVSVVPNNTAVSGLVHLAVESM